MSLRIYIYLYTAVLCCVVFSSCESYLDEKQEKSTSIPTKVTDLEALFRATGKINISMQPSLLEISTDDYLLDESAYNNLTEFEKESYRWSRSVNYLRINTSNEWAKAYETVLIANTVLDYLPKVEGNTMVKDNLRGEALFLRSWCFFNLAQLYAPVYTVAVRDRQEGIPLRIGSDLNITNSRATVGETYDRIVSDLKEAIGLLPLTSEHVTRPNRIAALALLARVFLSMSVYDQAERVAEKALAEYNRLIDFNKIAINAPNPFVRFNEETLYYATTAYIQMLHPSTAYINPALYDMYAHGDLRKNAYFAPKSNGHYSFKGSYDGTISGSQFIGLTTGELYLTLAECLVRRNDVSGAMGMLNTLLVNRWDLDEFSVIHIQDQEEALRVILNERRKELVFKGVRWMDLRRLNLDSRFSTVLTRTLGDQKFTLLPNDPRFVHLIPQEIIELSGINQNQR